LPVNASFCGRCGQSAELDDAQATHTGNPGATGTGNSDPGENIATLPLTLEANLHDAFANAPTRSTPSWGNYQPPGRRPGGPVTPPVPGVEDEDEEERRRRAA